MKKEIGGWQVRPELAEKLDCSPDGAFLDPVTGVNYSWVYEEKIPDNPRSAIYVKKENRSGVFYEVARLFNPKLDVLKSLRRETEIIIRKAEEQKENDYSVK